MNITKTSQLLKWIFSSFRIYTVPLLILAVITPIVSIAANTIVIHYVMGTCVNPTASAIMIICVFCIMHLLWRAKEWLSYRLASLVQKSVLDLLGIEIFQYPYSFFQSKTSANLTQALRNMTDGIDEVLSQCERLLMHAVQIVWTTGYFFYIGWEFGAVLGLYGFFALLISLLTVHLTYGETVRLSDRRVALISDIQDAYKCIISVWTCNNVHFEESRLKHNSAQQMCAERSLYLKLWLFDWLHGFVFMLFLCCLLWLVLCKSAAGLISVDDVCILATLYKEIAEVLLNITQDLSELIEEYGRVEQGLQMTQRPHPLRLYENNSLKGHSIVLQDLYYKYADTGASLLFEGCLSLPSKANVAFVGQSGGGKSTLVKLLLGFLDGYQGSITIGGTELSTLSPKLLHNLMTYIAQDGCLFRRTIRQNISYGTACDSATFTTVARLTGVSDFADLLPRKYDTVISELSAISGGQSQRILAARALLQNKPVCIFDEFTSALDPVQEAHIVNLIAKHKAQCLNIFITHRLHAVSTMDLAVVFNGGCIVSFGTPDTLMRTCPYYQRLLIAQSNSS